MAVGRMRKRAEFLAARKGRRLNGPLFFVEARDRGDGGEPRVGLTVTKKVGNAVERNRIRRRLREAVRLRAGADMAAGIDYVIVARRDLLDRVLRDAEGRTVATGREGRGPGSRSDHEQAASQPAPTRI